MAKRRSPSVRVALNLGSAICQSWTIRYSLNLSFLFCKMCTRVLIGLFDDYKWVNVYKALTTLVHSKTFLSVSHCYYHHQFFLTSFPDLLTLAIQLLQMACKIFCLPFAVSCHGEDPFIFFSQPTYFEHLLPYRILDMGAVEMSRNISLDSLGQITAQWGWQMLGFF